MSRSLHMDNLRSTGRQCKFPSPTLPTRDPPHLLRSLTDYCYSHGILIRQSPPSPDNPLAVHAPVTLYPGRFPRAPWDQARNLQTIYNLLYAKIANDTKWLGAIMDQYFLTCVWSKF